MKKIFLLIAILVSIIVVASIIKNKFMTAQPVPDPLLLETEEHIREVLLELTPVGTSMEDVLEVIYANEEWEIRRINDEQGYLVQGSPEGLYRVGEKSIRAVIGKYKDFWITLVIVNWGFDEDSKLIDIYVEKEADSL